MNDTLCELLLFDPPLRVANSMKFVLFSFKNNYVEARTRVRVLELCTREVNKRGIYRGIPPLMHQWAQIAYLLIKTNSYGPCVNTH